MAYIFSGLPGMKGLMPYWYNFALMFEALFILTTVDTGTRVARFILQELGGYVYAPISRTNWLPGTVLTSAVAVASWGLLINSGSISTIWPMFGVANQLLAALALCVGTTVILKTNKARYALVTVIPMAFMTIMTVTASFKLMRIFAQKAIAEPANAFTYRLDSMLVALMAGLAILAVLDAVIKWFGIMKSPRPIESRP